MEKIFNRTFEFLESGFLTGAENMKIDFERAMAVSKGEKSAMLRLYGWKPWAVSLGYNQKETDIDKFLCEKESFDIVRRPTGGRAVLHAEELTYSVCVNLPEKMNMHDAYRGIHLFLLKAMQDTGIENLDFKKSQMNMREFYSRPEMSASCFAAAAQYEIEYMGRKVVGSAQRMFGRTLLQHGSILLDKGYERLADVINQKTEQQNKRLKEFMLAGSATLSEAAGRKISFDDLSDSIKRLWKSF